MNKKNKTKNPSYYNKKLAQIIFYNYIVKKKVILSQTIMIGKLKTLVPGITFKFRNNDCIGIILTDSNYIYHGLIRHYSNSEKETILNLISKIETLEYLDLRKNCLGILPDLSHLNLKYLDLASNYLGIFPTWINNLVNLEFLNLGVNEINFIPEINLINLKTLKLHKNNIVKLPNLGDLYNLKFLNLYLNKIKNIPDFVFRLINLEYFSWGISSIKVLSGQIGKLINLKWLSLVINKLEYLPDSFCELTNLIGIRLHKNYLRELPKNIGNLINLEQLTVYDNKIEKLPESFSNLKKLRKLNLAKNLFNKPIEINNLSLDWLVI